MEEAELYEEKYGETYTNTLQRTPSIYLIYAICLQ